MTRKSSVTRNWPLWILAGAVLAAIALFLSRAERPPVAGVQRGVRGTGLNLVYNPRTIAALADANSIPASLPYVGDEGPRAGSVYQNVQVLENVSVGEVARLMVNMTKWIAPDQGCSACHNLADLADDSLYTKVVARRMLQMVRHINADWTAHVGQTGVTCYTCHRGQLVPQNVWFSNPGPVQAGGMSQSPVGKNHPSPVADGSALPLDPFTPFLEQSSEIRVQSVTPLSTDNRHSIKQAEWTYSLMINMSQSLGVDCDFCHNTRSFVDWAGSPPQRVTAWYGIRMVRDINNTFLDPLRPVFPSARLGPTGDAPKVFCATCHNGVYKPLFGASMMRDFPELKGAVSGPENDVSRSLLDDAQK